MIRQSGRAPFMAAILFVSLVGGCDNGGLLPVFEFLDLRMVTAPADFGFPEAQPTCIDRIKNGKESDVDCGGECGPCADGRACTVGDDCENKTCRGGLCISCTDGKQNGDETDLDCGGGECPVCKLGQECVQTKDCESRSCIDGRCAAPVSCLAIKQANVNANDGTFTIDPDGAGGMAPFQVYCDMTFDKGGWTVLPLNFGDPAWWSVKTSGTACTDGPTFDKNGYALSFQNSSANGWSYLSLRFLPPIRVSQVYFKGLIHSTASQCNNMDITYTAPPAMTNDQTAESWYFAGADPTVPLGYTFAAGCGSPGYSAVGGQYPECSMNQTDATNTITRQIALTKAAPSFHMVAVQGCQSSVCNAQMGQAERFLIQHPGTKGFWKEGILVR